MHHRVSKCATKIEVDEGFTHGENMLKYPRWPISSIALQETIQIVLILEHDPHGVTRVASLDIRHTPLEIDDRISRIVLHIPNSAWVDGPLRSSCLLAVVEDRTYFLSRRRR